MNLRYFVTLAILCYLSAVGCAGNRSDATLKTVSADDGTMSITPPPPLRPEPTLSESGTQWPTPTPHSGVVAVPSTTTIVTTPLVGWARYASINQIMHVAFAPDGTLWAMTMNGLVHWNLEAETYTRYLVPTFVTDMAVAQDGTLWLGTNGGLCHFAVPKDDPNADATCTFYTTAEGLIHNGVRAVATAADGTVWVGTERGVSRFTGSAGGRLDGASWHSAPSDFATQDLAVAPNGEVWHATAAGIARYVPETDGWEVYDEQHGLPSAHAQVVGTGPQGEVWVYILWNGIWRFDGARWQAVEKVPGGTIADIAFGPDGRPWIGTTGGTHYPGGSLVTRDGDGWIDVTAAEGLTSIRTVALGPQGLVAAGTNMGLGVYQDGEWRLLRDGPTRDRVTAVAVTPDGATWFGFGDHSASTLGGGLSRLAASGAQPGDGPEWTYHLDDAEVNTLAVAPDGTLWAGVSCDVQVYDGAAWHTVGRCGEDYPTGTVLDIAFTSDGAVWVATGFNLARLAAPQGVPQGGAGSERSWMVYDRLVNSLSAAPDGAIWMNGWEGRQGSNYVARFDGAEWESFETADAYPGSLVAGAITSEGDVWGIVAGQGLARWNGESWAEAESWSLFAPEDGFVLDNARGPALAPDGALWLVADGGVARFDPAVLEQDQPPETAWTTYATGDQGATVYGPIAFGTNGEIWVGAARLLPGW